MNKKILGFISAAMGATLLLAPQAAFADSVGVTAVVDSTTVTGSRAITTVPTTLTMNSAAAGAVTGALTVVVTELTMLPPSTNPWSVTCILTGDLISGGNSIPSSDMFLTPTSTVTTNLASGVTMAAGAANQSLAHTGSAASLYTVSGETGTNLYSGVYTAAGTLKLTIPSGTTSGSYTSTMTVTLIQ